EKAGIRRGRRVTSGCHRWSRRIQRVAAAFETPLAAPGAARDSGTHGLDYSRRAELRFVATGLAARGSAWRSVVLRDVFAEASAACRRTRVRRHCEHDARSRVAVRGTRAQAGALGLAVP